MKTYWCIPPKQDADFIAHMEDVIDVYERPYCKEFPVICLDEKPYQLLGDVRSPLPMRPGQNLKEDAEYERNGTCSIFAVIEPLTGRQHISVRERRTALDWAEEIQYICDVMYPKAKTIVVVMDNQATGGTPFGKAAGDSLYPETWQLAGYGRNRIEHSYQAVPGQTCRFH